MCATDTPLGIALRNIRTHPTPLNVLNGLVYFLIIGDPRGDKLMVGSITRNLLTELGIRTEDAKCKIMGDKCNFVNLVLIIKVVWVSTILRQVIDTPVIKMTSQY